MLTLSGYTIEGIIHRGRETTIYRGVRDSDGFPVAIKVSSRPIPTPRDRARLRYEYELLKELEQPGVVRTLSLESGSKGLCLVLERLSGLPLDQYLPQSIPTIRQSLDLAIAMTASIAAVHSRNVVHKDAYDFSKVCFLAHYLGPQRRRNKPCPLTASATARSALTSHQ